MSKNIISNEICEQPIGSEFTLNRPYEIGLDYYLRRMNYNVVQNLTQTFAVSGVYSESFVKLFRYISNRVTEETI